MIPNARISVLRGEFTDEWGDTHDTTQPVATDVPASLVVMTEVVTSPETGRSFDVEYLDGYVKPRQDVRKGDRVLNQATGDIFTVDGVYASSIFMKPDKRLRLRRLST